MTYQQNIAGIASQEGFIFQIHAFFYYAFDLQKNQQLEFETFDDVSLVTSDETTHNLDCVCALTVSSVNKAIQVKYTAVKNSSFKKIFANWLLLSYTAENIQEYVLFTDEKYKNSKLNYLSNINIDLLYSEILNNTQRSDSTLAKLKSLIGNDKNKFECICNKIMQSFMLVSIENINNEITKKAEDVLRKIVCEDLFKRRLNELFLRIHNNILKSIKTREPYILTYKNFIEILDDVCCKISLTDNIPHFPSFKSSQSINLEDSEINTTRQFKQLKACNLPDEQIKGHLIYQLYYQAIYYQYIEQNRSGKAEEIEELSFENFSKSKTYLEFQNNDTPYNRFYETQQKSNSYAQNEQIKYGALIYLTKNDVGTKQISWKDDSNA